MCTLTYVLNFISHSYVHSDGSLYALISHSLGCTIYLNTLDFFPSFLIILFIALIPGLMQMFLFISYLLDKRPTAKSVDNNVPVTILIAAYNEEDCIGKTLVSISKQNYSGIVQVIVIDDGSTDETINIVESFSLPNLLLIKNSHGGKANALNTGLARSDHSLIIGLDADTQLRSSAIKDLSRPFTLRPSRYGRCSRLIICQ